MHPISIDTDGVCRTLLSPDCVQHTIMVTLQGNVFTSAANRLIGEVCTSTSTEKAPTRAFSWLKAPTSAFTFKTLLRHYAKQALTPWSLNVKLGPRRKGHKGRAVWLV